MPFEVSTLADLCEKASQTYGARPALGTKRQGQWHWLTYAELGDAVARCRRGLSDLGVGPGDRVAVVSGNRAEWAILAYAAAGLRAALVPMYEAQAPKEWAYILEDSGAKVAVASNVAFDALEPLAQTLPALTAVVGLDLPAEHPRSFQRVLAPEATAPRLTPEPEEVAGIIYTSGTTGTPKGVLLSHRNVCTNILGVRERFPLENDTSLSFLPWAHAFGQTADLHFMILTGTSIALNDEVPKLLENLAEVRPTVLCAVPRIWNRVYDRVNQSMADRPAFLQGLFRSGVAASKKKKSGASLGVGESLALGVASRLVFKSIRAKLGGRLRFVVSGSAALSKEVAEFIDALGITIYEGYGLTETGPVVSANYAGHVKIGSVGPTIPGVRVVIDRTATADPRDGEIIVYGPNVMLGYHNRPEDTAERFTADGGLRTGDIGHVDEDGFVFITGRIKEQYKLENGKYVVPSPLEEELKLSPYIANAFLFGENRPHNVALIVPDRDALQRWAPQTETPLGDPLTNPRVRALITSELEQRGANMKSFERPRGFALLEEDFTVDNGLLTPSMKLRREKVLALYKDRIEALYRPTAS
jgi:long-chain acyl-CoA synthetase